MHKEFKDKIKDYRKELGLSQKELAFCIDVPLSTYRKWEQGYSTPHTLIQDVILGNLTEMLAFNTAEHERSK